MQVRYQAALRPVNQRVRIIVHPLTKVKGKVDAAASSSSKKHM
jgi:hypothetical protein